LCSARERGQRGIEGEPRQLGAGLEIPQPQRLIPRAERARRPFASTVTLVTQFSCLVGLEFLVVR
jgi:hypothetical protein